MSATSPAVQTSVHVSEDVKREMFNVFQNWALKNYGDSGKTKTVTRRKYNRIVKTLSGEEHNSADNSKFRFWVKAKGFRLGPPEGLNGDAACDKVLFVPTKHTKRGRLWPQKTPFSDSEISAGTSKIRKPSVENKTENGEPGFKRVAIVEDFFDIIYNVHVDIDGRGGKHAGQKRTYRAIAETYAFLPREAVTRFLMSCAHCQKRMHVPTATEEANNNSNLDESIVDFNFPITTTYLKHVQAKGCSVDDGYLYKMDAEDSMSSGLSETSVHADRPVSPNNNTTEDILDAKENDDGISMENSRTATPVEESDSKPDVVDGVLAKDGKENIDTDQNTGGHPERKRRASDELSLDSSTKTSEALDDTKDDDDNDDDDEDDLKITSKEWDPERLKSFNMFVRLFVDENLDRVVPISKQPKDKVQAILEACNRQFPEFQERSRKRIRTYLKSCRRMRRSKDANGIEQLRPTPPHLTSAAAESILAQACENESQNAKRMRMGLEPLAVSLDSVKRKSPPSVVVGGGGGSTASEQTLALPPPASPAIAAIQTSSSQQSLPPASSPAVQAALDRPATDFPRHAPPTAFRPPHELTQAFTFTNGNGLFRPGFAGFQHPAHNHATLLQQSLTSSQVQNGPADLSVKKGKNTLNPQEVATIKQLISGYRESAAFLYRSADELEQLLLQQN